MLIRNIVDDNLKYHLIYKDKSYDVNGKIVSQNKIYAKIESVEDVKKTLESVDQITLFEIENYSTVYKKDDKEIVIQKITDPSKTGSYTVSICNELNKCDSEACYLKFREDFL